MKWYIQKSQKKIIGCAMKVHTELLGFGFQEYIYHRALELK